MDKPEYTSKAQVLLEDGKTYQEIKFDPTNKYKKRLINLLKKMKAEGGTIDTLYKKMYPKEQWHQNFMGWPRYIRETSPSDQ